MPTNKSSNKSSTKTPMKKSIKMTIKKSIKNSSSKKNNKPIKRKTIKIKRKIIKKNNKNIKNSFKLGQKVVVKDKEGRNVYAEIVKLAQNKVNVKFTDKDIIEKYGNKPVSYNSNKVKKKHSNKKGNSIVLSVKEREEHQNKIKPLFWTRPYDKEFPEWINATFMKYHISKTEKSKNSKSKKVFKPFLYQNFLRDYLQKDSPYRGILLYHGLGSGKTCSAINIAENLKTDLDIIVMLPASLKTNFIEDGLKFCGDPIYKSNERALYDKYKFISYNASNVAKQIKDIGTLNNKVIIIDEVHNLLSIIVNGLLSGGTNGRLIYESIMNAQNTKIIALTGTPVVNAAFELAVLFNMLRGYIEITIFRVVDKYLERDFDHIESIIMDNPHVDYVKYNRGNKTFDVHIMVEHWNDKYREIIREIEDEVLKRETLTIKYFHTPTGPQLFTAFPDEIEGGEPRRFNQYFIKENDDGEELINRNLFQRRILGLVSYYGDQKDDFPEVKMHDITKIPMSDYQFTEYNFVREIEKKAEQQGAKQSKKDKKKKTKSYFRVLSRQYSNFVFPDDIERPWPNQKLMLKLKQAKTQKNNSENAEEVSNLLKKMDESDAKINTKAFKKKLEKALDDLSKGEYLLSSKDELDVYSPKMEEMFKNINKSTGLVFGYSNFRSVEGVEIFARVLEKNGYKRFDPKEGRNKKYKYKQFAIYSGSEDYEERKAIVEKFNSYENRKGEHLKIILATAAGAEGLDLHNIRQIHIMEPYWNEVKIEQVIGRGVRRKSHEDLPLNERNVEVFRYLSVFTKEQAVKAVDKVSTDEHILELAIRKKLLTDELLKVLKETSVDCWLNNFGLKGNFECFTFGKGAKGIASVPDIMQNRLFDTNKNVKIKKTKVIVGRIDKKDFVLFYDKKSKKCFNVIDKLMKNPIKPKPGMFKKKVAINIDEKKVYDYKDAKSSNPTAIGTFNDMGRFIKA